MVCQARVPKVFCTTREAAEILGVSLRTAQLWTESGLLKGWKTDGGHRRISRESIECLLALPSQHGKTETGKLRKSIAETGGVSSPFSILVVAEEGELRRLYEASLLCWSMPSHVTVVSDGYQALIRIGLLRPAMVVIDVRQPEANDLQMARAIRAVPELAKTRVVVVTDYGWDTLGGVPDGIASDISVLSRPVPFNRLRDIAEQAAFRRV